MGLFQTYLYTEGLDRFPPSQQFCVWRAAHKRLKTNDPDYRAQCRRFNGKMLLATLMYCVVVIIPSHWLDLGMIDDLVIGLVATAVFLPCYLIASWRQQGWLNTRVAEVIKRRRTRGDKRG